MRWWDTHSEHGLHRLAEEHDVVFNVLALDRHLRHLGDLLQHHERLLVRLVAHLHRWHLMFRHLRRRSVLAERQPLVMCVAGALGLNERRLLVLLLPLELEEHIILYAGGVSRRDLADSGAELWPRRIHPPGAAYLRLSRALRPRRGHHIWLVRLLPGGRHEALGAVLLENLAVVHVVVDVIEVSMMVVGRLFALFLFWHSEIDRAKAVLNFRVARLIQLSLGPTLFAAVRPLGHLRVAATTGVASLRLRWLECIHCGVRTHTVASSNVAAGCCDGSAPLPA